MTLEYLHLFNTFEYNSIQIDFRNDGGSSVTSYDLEARVYRENNWFSVGHDRLKLCRLECRGSYEVGQHYVIRVRAVNAAGHGPWSIESDQMVCKYKALKPKITFRYIYRQQPFPCFQCIMTKRDISK